MINFTLHIYLAPVGSDKATVLALEQYFIDTLNPAYNILKIAGSSAGNPISEKNKAMLREVRGEKSIGITLTLPYYFMYFCLKLICLSS